MTWGLFPSISRDCSRGRFGLKLHPTFENHLTFCTLLNLSALEQIPKALVLVIACPPEDGRQNECSECPFSASLRMPDSGPVLPLQATRTEVLGQPSSTTVGFKHFCRHGDTVSKADVEQVPRIV